jgi:hypothetical protein
MLCWLNLSAIDRKSKDRGCCWESRNTGSSTELLAIIEAVDTLSSQRTVENQVSGYRVSSKKQNNIKLSVDIDSRRLSLHFGQVWLVTDK